MVCILSIEYSVTFFGEAESAIAVRGAGDSYIWGVDIDDAMTEWVGDDLALKCCKRDPNNMNKNSIQESMYL